MLIQSIVKKWFFKIFKGLKRVKYTVILLMIFIYIVHKICWSSVILSIIIAHFIQLWMQSLIHFMTVMEAERKWMRNRWIFFSLKYIFKLGSNWYSWKKPLGSRHVWTLKWTMQACVRLVLLSTPTLVWQRLVPDCSQLPWDTSFGAIPLFWSQALPLSPSENCLFPPALLPTGLCLYAAWPKITRQFPIRLENVDSSEEIWASIPIIEQIVGIGIWLAWDTCALGCWLI